MRGALSEFIKELAEQVDHPDSPDDEPPQTWHLDTVGEFCNTEWKHIHNKEVQKPSDQKEKFLYGSMEEWTAGKLFHAIGKHGWDALNCFSKTYFYSVAKVNIPCGDSELHGVDQGPQVPLGNCSSLLVHGYLALVISIDFVV